MIVIARRAREIERTPPGGPNRGWPGHPRGV